MAESMKRCDSGKTYKNKALCDRQNSEISMKLHGSDVGGTSGNSEHRDPELADCGHSQKSEKCTGPKTMYIEVDKNVDVTKVGRNSDFVVRVQSSIDADKKSETTRSSYVTKKKLCKYFTMLIACVAISILCGVYIVPKLSGERNTLIPVEEAPQGAPHTAPQAAPHAEKLTGSMSNAAGGGFHWATFYLDDDVFQKGMESFPWKLEEGDAGISVTESGCFRLSKTSVYEFYSKMTFEFTEHNTTDKDISHYHNVQRVRQIGYPPKKDQEILDKNILSAPYRPPNVIRVFQTSSLIVLGEFLAGDQICVYVGESSLVYNSKSDNTVKIIQRGD